MGSHKDIVHLLGGVKAIGRSIRTLADLEAAIQAGFPRAALENLMNAVAPETERARDCAIVSFRARAFSAVRS